MANYVKATNFTAKDSLPSGNSSKIVKGAELDTEYNAVASAISSKADINSPAFTGTPTVPTATVGSNTTQAASTAFVKSAVDALGTIGTMAAQNATAVAITGGSIAGITDLAVADGGTGRSTLAANAVVVGNGTSGVNTVAPGTNGNVLTSNGTAWTSAAPAVVRGLGLGGEVWNNVTGSRAFGTTYTNSRGYPIMISATSNASGSSGLTINVNGTEVYFNQAQWNGAGAYGGGTLIIPPGATYSVTASSSLRTWWELY
jgi:hypothetical protein